MKIKIGKADFSRRREIRNHCIQQLNHSLVFQTASTKNGDKRELLSLIASLIVRIVDEFYGAEHDELPAEVGLDLASARLLPNTNPRMTNPLLLIVQLDEFER